MPFNEFCIKTAGILGVSKDLLYSGEQYVAVSLFSFVFFRVTRRVINAVRIVLFKSTIKVDREDHFQRPGFLHITTCVFLGCKVSKFVKKIGCYQCLKTSKSEGFDGQTRPRPI